MSSPYRVAEVESGIDLTLPENAPLGQRSTFAFGGQTIVFVRDRIMVSKPEDGMTLYIHYWRLETP